MNKFAELTSKFNVDAIITIAPSNIRYSTGYLADYCYAVTTRIAQYYLTDGRFTIEANRDLSSDWEVVEISPATATKIITDILLNDKVSKIAFDSDVKHSEYLFIERLLSSFDSTDVTIEMSKIRSIKTASEIKLIVKAQRIAENALVELKRYIKQGVSEREIAARLDYIMRINGSDGVSFDTIVAFGENSAIAHAKPSDRQLKRGDIILIDFGAKCNGYCSDMTRCFVFGECSEYIERMYNCVLGANEIAIGAIRSGMPCAEADRVARNYINVFGYGESFTHSLGHGVGVDIHEAPYLSSRAARSEVLEDNMVVTVEPGIYIEGLGGIRIEDMIVVRGAIATNLTTSNKKLEIIN